MSFKSAKKHTTRLIYRLVPSVDGADWPNPNMADVIRKEVAMSLGRGLGLLFGVGLVWMLGTIAVWWVF